jgi:hypothetical protein
MKFVIINKQSLEIMGHYEADAKDDSSANRSWLLAEPVCAHLEMPEGLDLDCLKAVQVEESFDPETQLIIPAHLAVQEDAAKIAAKLAASREAKLGALRALRAPKLARVDQLVNIAFLNSWTAGEKAELKDHRAALLNITEPYKADASLLDDLDIEAIEWPEEPSES